jgi:hypothetical protein
MGPIASGSALESLEGMSIGRDPGANIMSKALRIVSVEPVIYGVIKLVWTDGYEGVVDLRPVIARGRIFSYLRKPRAFAKVQLEEHGHWIFLVNEKGEEIDFGADSLRETAKKQTQMHALMAV